MIRLATMAPKQNVFQKFMIFLLKLPAVAQVYFSVISFSFLMISDEVIIKGIGFLGTLTTAGLALLRYVRDKRQERKLTRTEAKLEAAEATLEKMKADNELLAQRNTEFENERAQFRADIEARVQLIEKQWKQDNDK